MSPLSWNHDHVARSLRRGRNMALPSWYVTTCRPSYCFEPYLSSPMISHVCLRRQHMRLVSRINQRVANSSRRPRYTSLLTPLHGLAGTVLWRLWQRGAAKLARYKLRTTCRILHRSTAKSRRRSRYLDGDPVQERYSLACVRYAASLRGTTVFTSAKALCTVSLVNFTHKENVKCYTTIDVAFMASIKCVDVG